MRSFAIGQAMALALALAACGTAGQPSATVPSERPEEPILSASPSTDGSSPSAEPATVLEPSVRYDLGHEIFILLEHEGVVYAQVGSDILGVDPATGEFERVVAGPEPPWGMNIGFGSAWVSTDPPGIVDRYDLVSGELIASIPVGELPVESLTAYGAIWVPNDHSGTVSRIDPETNEVIAIIEVLPRPIGGPVHVSAGADRVWATSPGASRVSGIDPSTDEVAVMLSTPELVCGSTVSGGLLWVGSCERPSRTWVRETATGGPVGELEGMVVGDEEHTLLLTIDVLTGDTIVRAVDPEDLSLGAPVTWPDVPNYVTFGSEMLWAAVGAELLGYAIDSLPTP